jgi:hypothetical protein
LKAFISLEISFLLITGSSGEIKDPGDDERKVEMITDFLNGWKVHGRLASPRQLFGSYDPRSSEKLHFQNCMFQQK